MLEKTYEGLKTTTLKTSQAFINKGKIIELTKDLEQKNIAVEEAHIAVMKAQQQGYAILNGHIVVLKSAKEAQAIATLQADAAQKKLNVTMAPNPMGAILIVFTGLITAFTVITKLYAHFTMPTQQAARLFRLLILNKKN